MPYPYTSVTYDDLSNLYHGSLFVKWHTIFGYPGQSGTHFGVTITPSGEVAGWEYGPSIVGASYEALEEWLKKEPLAAPARGPILNFLLFAFAAVDFWESKKEEH